MKYREVVLVIQDYDSRVDRHIVLNRPWFTRPTKLTDGYNSIEIMFNISISPDRHYYSIRNMESYRFQWPCGTRLTEINMVTEELNNKHKDVPFPQPKSNISMQQKWMKVMGEYEYGGNTESFIEKGLIEPLYLEEDLVPSQFFGLNDYLKCKI